MAKKHSTTIDYRYKNTTDMIKAALIAGFKHRGGKGFMCRGCHHKSSARKFTKGRGTLYACNLCGARWGSLIKGNPAPKTKNPVPEAEEKPTTGVLYSDLKVLSSNAGFYIGRVDIHGGPYSRESGYYKTFGIATQALEDGFELRGCGENDIAYEMGALPDIRKGKEKTC